MQSTQKKSLLVSSPFSSWLAIQPNIAARRLGVETEELVVNQDMDINTVWKRVKQGGVEEIIFITLHSINACGGAKAVERFAAQVDVTVTVWNVDCAPLVYHLLPIHEAIRYIHASQSDARYWQDYFVPGCRTGFTYGVGPHNPTPKSIRDLQHRSSALLAPINLRWCSRTLAEIQREIKSSPKPVRDKCFEIFESYRKKPKTDVPQAIAADKSLTHEEIIEASRYCVYAIQLWRREWLVEKLLDQPVLIDSNYWPEHLTNRLSNATATVLSQSTITETDRRLLDTQAVVSCSSSHDLYHDRISCAFTSGCMGIAENNGIYTEVHGGNGMLYYTFEAESISNIMDIVMTEQALMQNIAHTGRQQFESLYPDMGFTSLFACTDEEADSDSGNHIEKAPLAGNIGL